MRYPRYTKLYGVWANMKERCDNPNYISYRHYGGRGISYSPSWADYDSFCDDMAHNYKEGLTLDRENNSLGYSKENCRWVNKTVQANNTRSNNYIEHNDRRLTIAEWARLVGLKHNTLWCRIMVYNWPIERALSPQLTRGRKPQ